MWMYLEFVIFDMYKSSERVKLIFVYKKMNITIITSSVGPLDGIWLGQALKFLVSTRTDYGRYEFKANYAL